MAETMLDEFVKKLIITEKSIDPVLAAAARSWYENFTGKHAVKMADEEVVDLYTSLS